MVQASPPVSARQSSMGAPISTRSATYTDNAPVLTGPPLTPVTLGLIWMAGMDITQCK
jgi:hypothetical protein